jgi:hypothetical protein
MSLVALAPLAALPWLQGFFAPTGLTETGSRTVIAELAEWQAPIEECVASTYGGMSLDADVVPGDGNETVLASYTQGVFVLDRDRHLLAQAPGFPCEGCADELVAIATGDLSIGVPIIALAATSGGHAESATWLTIYRVSNSGELQPAFIGEVERHDHRTTRTGLVVAIPGGLVYRDPAGSISLWLYDAALGRYIEHLTTRPYA